MRHSSSLSLVVGIILTLACAAGLIACGGGDPEPEKHHPLDCGDPQPAHPELCPK